MLRAALADRNTRLMVLRSILRSASQFLYRHFDHSFDEGRLGNRRFSFPVLQYLEIQKAHVFPVLEQFRPRQPKLAAVHLGSSTTD